MLLQELVSASDAISEVSGRKEKIRRLAALLGRAVPGGPEEVDIAASFLSGSPRQGRIGLGPAALTRARQVPPAPAPSLDLPAVDTALSRIAALSGPGSAGERARQLAALLGQATAQEQGFLLRLLSGDLRQGALEGVLLEAVALAAEVPAERVRRAAMMAGSLPKVAQAALCEGEAALGRFSLQLLQPVQPMLAESAGDVADALDSLGEAALEYKLDGARIQVHKAGDVVRVFSRQLRDVTAAVPEVVEVMRALPARDLILDGEVLALRPDGAPQPFQVTMRRFGRKLDVDRLRQELPLSPFFFDCLHLDGSDLLDEPQRRRAEALRGIVPAAGRMPTLLTADPEQAEAFYAAAVQAGHEGLMAKAPEAGYATGRRGGAWLKIKPAHTLDLVVLAAEWGNGRRTGWLSNLHLGARDPERGGFVMLGKTFKGLTDEMLAWQTARLQELAIGQDEYTVYVRPELVAEVAFGDVQASPQYPAGMALRFARVKRYRADKPASEADTIATVARIFAGQRGP
jgi:DNA ligase-1